MILFLEDDFTQKRKVLQKNKAVFKSLCCFANFNTLREKLNMIRMKIFGSPTFVFHGITVVSLPSTAYFHSNFGFKFQKAYLYSIIK
jgi:hypothetical protein